MLAVGTEIPENKVVTLNGHTYDLRVVCVMKSSDHVHNFNRFESICYMRHGNEMSNWWKEE